MPDELYTISNAVGSSNLATESLPVTSCPWFTPHWSESESTDIALFSNKSIFCLVSWYYNLSNIKSHGELNRLMNDAILAPDFLPGGRASSEADARKFEVMGLYYCQLLEV